MKQLPCISGTYLVVHLSCFNIKTLRPSFLSLSQLSHTQTHTGYTFNLVNTVYDSSDNSLYDVCTTSVHTTRSSSSSSYAFAGLGALTTLLVGAYVGKKRRSLATIDLAKEESIITAASTQQADFVEMIDRGVAV
jgi:hypothetical protein